MTIEQEIERAIDAIKGSGKLFFDNRQRVAAMGGAFAASSMESKTPRGIKVHRRYNTAKAISRIKAPKGMGSVVAEYYPGNLQRSVNVLKFRRAKSKVYVGAKLARRSSGKFAGLRSDGYYLGWQDRGTKHFAGRNFWLPAWESAKPRVFKIMLAEFQRIGADYERQKAI